VINLYFTTRKQMAYACTSRRAHGAHQKGNGMGSQTSTESPARYGTVAIVLHWVLGAAIVGAFCFGLYLDDMPRSLAKLQFMNWHKWAGICILLASVGRLLWRFTHRPPDLPEAIARTMPGWQHLAHRATHGLLYAMFLLVPLAGWAYSSARGYPVVLFGLWPLPDLVGKNPEIAEWFEEAHAIGAFALMGLVGLHVLGVVKHQLIDRDGLLKRMLP
jgi:cytochrome b561